mgnify:CR=1 FL=1
MSSIAAQGRGYIPNTSAYILLSFPVAPLNPEKHHSILLWQHLASAKERTWASKSVCSKRGPAMASDRGLWLRDHTSARLGACMTADAGRPVSATSASAVAVGAAGVGVCVCESWRAVAVNVRFEISCRAWATARTPREAYIISRGRRIPRFLADCCFYFCCFDKAVVSIGFSVGFGSRVPGGERGRGN